MLLKKQLWVKRSRLPGSGKGLFTKTGIAKGSIIIEYKGRISTWKELEKITENGYLFYVNRSHVINAFPYKKAMARYANDAKGLTRRKGMANNSEYVTDGLKVYIKAMRGIRAGEEILVGYGKEYWDAIRENGEN
jgi:hypothetical protein